MLRLRGAESRILMIQNPDTPPRAPVFPRTLFFAGASMDPRLIWINLLVKLGVAAAVSSSLVRSVEFKSLLFREERSLLQKTYLVLWFGLPIMLGVWIR